VRRVATIDGLRGVAIIAVVMFHVWQINWQPISIFSLSLQPFIETGFIGVDLFFFISGFVLMLPYKTAAPTITEFVQRRVLKIVPSYVFCVGVLLIIGYEHADLKSVILHVLFVFNWFSDTSGAINGVFWSLAVEVQFYVLLPFLAPRFARRPIVWTVLLFAVANGWRLWCMFSSHYFYTMRLEQLHIDAFAAGMLLATLSVRASTPRAKTLYSLLMAAGIVGVGLLANDCFAHRYENEWPNFWNVRWRSGLAVAFFCTALGSLYAWRPVQAVLANRPLIFLAGISYNLYLWHLPIARELLALHLPPYAGDPHQDGSWQVAFWLVAIEGSIAVAVALTYGLERPLMRVRWERLAWLKRRPLAIDGARAALTGADGRRAFAGTERGVGELPSDGIGLV
jgi:peptidoglycan/LPS O-acetylase OafA/YrhL